MWLRSAMGKPFRWVNQGNREVEPAHPAVPPQLEPLEPRLLLSSALMGGLEPLGDDERPLAQPAIEVAALPEAPPEQTGGESDMAPPVGAEGFSPAPAAAPFPYSDTFQLHSNPGADHVIYLDFDGHTTSNTAWNDNENGDNDFTTPAYDWASDGDPSHFTDGEKTDIQQSWQRVAEDYIPFDVDVTTEFPGASYLRKFSRVDPTWGVRVVIGGASTDWYVDPGDNGAGGVAYVGSYDNYKDTPAYVFTEDQSRADGFVGEAASHESGHTLGLHHAWEDLDGDGQIDRKDFPGDTDVDNPYYGGHTTTGGFNWAPIMGNSYYDDVTQWDKGEFNNALVTEDDLAIISSSTNGFGYRSDDHSSTYRDPDPLNVSSNGTSVSGSGIIEREYDADWFAFTHGGGDIDIEIDPYELGPNLNIGVQLWDADPISHITNDDPAGDLGASLHRDLPAGEYLLRVAGRGEGNPGSSGYSDYGSLGQYTISGNKTRQFGDLPTNMTSAEGFAWFQHDGNSDNQFDVNLGIDYEGDIDSVYFAGDTGWLGNYQIDLGDNGNGLDPLLGLYDADTGDLLYSDYASGPNDDARLDVDLSDAKRYIIAAADLYDDETGEMTLSINAPDYSTIVRTVSLDELGDGSRTGQILSLNDTDFFQFDAPADTNGLLNAVVTPTSSNLDVTAFLYDESGNVLNSSYDNPAGWTEVMSTSGITPGETYYLAVLPRNYGSAGNFDLEITFPSPDRFEPNDSFSSAADLPYGDQVQNDLNLHDEGDSDYYRWTAPDDGQLTVDVLFSDADGDIDMGLYDSSENRITFSSSSDDNESVTANVTGGDDYFIHIYGYQDVKQPDYELEIDGPTILPDRFEENDSFSTAYDFGPVGDRTENNLTIDSPRDDDYYTWTAPADGKLTVDALFSHADGDIQLALYDDTDSLLYFSISSTDDESVSHSVTAGDDYTIRVFAGGETHPDYDLVIDGPEIAPDRFEENDSFSTAYDFGPGDRTETHLTTDSRGDDDYYSWTASADGQLTVDALFSHALGDLDMRLLDDNQAIIDSSLSTNDNESVSASVTAGSQYTIRIIAYDYAGAPHPDYDLVIDGPEPAAIAGRHVFYNNSAFDGDDAAANSGDNAAIATDKQALLPGSTATFANYTSYSRGINGVMVDLAGADLSNLSANDFQFAIGNDSTPGGWATGPVPTNVSVRDGAGVGGSDRVTLTWADHAIEKQWLRVTVEATGQTGLAGDDVFYFGNWAGETGNNPAGTKVDSFDTGLTRDHSTGLFGSASIVNRYDFNRDEAVDSFDFAIARDNASGLFSRLSLIQPPNIASGSTLFTNADHEDEPVIFGFDKSQVL